MTSLAPSPPRPYRLQPLQALKAYRRLLSDKEDTVAVFEIMRALNGRSTARGYHRLLASPEGGRQAYVRPELAPALDDAAYVDGFAAGTVGAAYRDFVRSENLSAGGLVQVSQAANGAAPDVPHPYAWFGRRIRDTHDLWHVLTGYGRDATGEACLVAFSFAQTGGLGWGFIAIGAMLQSLRLKAPAVYRKAIVEGWRLGRAAAWLPAEDYERLLREPLDVARRRLKLGRPEAYLAIPVEARDRQARAAA